MQKARRRLLEPLAFAKRRGPSFSHPPFEARVIYARVRDFLLTRSGSLDTDQQGWLCQPTKRALANYASDSLQITRRNRTKRKPSGFLPFARIHSTISLAFPSKRLSSRVGSVPCERVLATVFFFFFFFIETNESRGVEIRA